MKTHFNIIKVRVLVTMEDQSKAIFAGIEGEKSPKSRSCEWILRLLAFVLTLAAAIVIGTDKQTKVVPIKIADSLPPFNVPVSAKWHYLSAFM